MNSTPTPRNERELDVVVWGATGFTGRLVAEEMVRLERAGELPEGFGWGVGGRDRERLDRLADELAASRDGSRQIPVIVADSHDLTSLKALVYRSRAVASTVGPYGIHGTLLVQAAAEAGTDLCDLSGEVPWMRRMIDRFHELARRSGARIVHAAGFDSIPSDLGVLACHRRLEREGRRLEGARLRVRRASGRFSGGTVASLFHVMEEAKEDPAARRLLADPYALNPSGERPPAGGRDVPESFSVARDRDRDVWTAPFMMAGINTRVVRRSNALLGFPYGHDFLYDERIDAGRGVGGWLRAQMLAAGTGLFMGAASAAPGIAGRFLPSPGEGPSAAVRESGRFEIRVYGETGEPDGTGERSPLEVVTTLGIDLDPGYGATARMLAASAVLLATTEPAGASSGVVTPAVSLGLPLVDRLRRAGFTFETELLPPDRPSHPPEVPDAS